MINIPETMPHDSAFAPSCNVGPNHQGRISARSARALCGMYPMPAPGSETVVAGRGSAALYVANMSSAYVLLSYSVPVADWPQVFGVMLKRHARKNARQLAEQLRRLAANQTISADDYAALRNHESSTNNDRDAMQRTMYGRALPEDAARLESLAQELERKTV